jgi:hypothetical protein
VDVVPHDRAGIARVLPLAHHLSEGLADQRDLLVVEAQQLMLEQPARLLVEPPQLRGPRLHRLPPVVQLAEVRDLLDAHLVRELPRGSFGSHQPYAVQMR